MKAAKPEGQINTLYGTISNYPRYTCLHSESFFPDTGATLNIIGLQVARDNQLRITKLKAARRIVEASWNTLDIIGEKYFYVKLDNFGGKAKRLIYDSFPVETIDQYVHRYLTGEIKLV